MPDPDLLIRPGGESRLSNFLLFQLAHAEAARQRRVLARLSAATLGARGRGLSGAGRASRRVTAAPSRANRGPRHEPARRRRGSCSAALGFGCVLYAPAFALLVLAIALGCLWEFDRLSARKGQELVFRSPPQRSTAFIVLAEFGLLHATSGNW